MKRTTKGPDWYRHPVDRDICIHCGVNIIRFPQSNDRWLHDVSVRVPVAGCPTRNQRIRRLNMAHDDLLRMAQAGIQNLPGTKEFTLPKIGPVRLEYYGAYCSGGHALPSVNERTVAITLLGKRFQATFKMRDANILRSPYPICGKCYDLASE